MAQLPATVRVPMSEAMSQLSLRVVVTGRRRAALRTRVGVWLLGIAADVIGVGSIDVSVAEANGTPAA